MLGSPRYTRAIIVDNSLLAIYSFGSARLRLDARKAPTAGRLSSLVPPLCVVKATDVHTLTATEVSGYVSSFSLRKTVLEAERKGSQSTTQIPPLNYQTRMVREVDSGASGEIGRAHV